jgi:poly(U)-specific endoribonuclease
MKMPVSTTIAILIALFPLTHSEYLLPRFDVSDQQLQSLVDELRSSDKAEHNRRILVNYQGHTTTRDRADHAAERLFSRLDEKILHKPTFQKFISLMDNYNWATGETEDNTLQEQAEVKEFLDAVFRTRTWSIFSSFLRRNNHPFARDERTLKDKVRQLWFGQYSRARGRPDTSGFEHVFLGESKNGEIGGLHNWVTFYLRERNESAEFDYKGFLVQRFNVMAAVKFTWKSLWKNAGSLFIGTSPEFDLALYTACFLSRRGRNTCNLELDGCPFIITSFDINQERRIYVGSVYPSAGRMTDKCRANNA